MESTGKEKLQFHFGSFGRFIPVIIAVIFIFIAGINQTNVNGYVIAFFAAVIASVPFAKTPQTYGEAVVSGVQRPIFAIISGAIILASIAGKIVSSSGLIQTLATYVIDFNFTGGVFAASAFVICCVLSLSTGTSVGTNIITFPILFPIGVLAGVEPGFMAGALASGAIFGDNLAPISDTTIASAGTQKAEMGGVVRTRLWYSIPAALLTFIVLLLFAGKGGQVVANAAATDMVASPLSIVMLSVPLVIIALCFMRKHLIVALSWGIVVGVLVGLLSGLYKFSDYFTYPGGFSVDGIVINAIVGTVGTIMMLYGVFCLLGVLEKGGVVDIIGEKMSGWAKGVQSTEITIVASIGVMSWLTGVVTVSIAALGEIVSTIGEKVGLNKFRRANLMDCGGLALGALVPWSVHVVLPMQLATASAENVTLLPTQVLTHNFYCIFMIVILIIMITTGYGRNQNPENNNTTKA